MSLMVLNAPNSQGHFSAAPRFGHGQSRTVSPSNSPAVVSLTAPERLIQRVLIKLVPGWMVKPTLQLNDVWDLSPAWLEKQRIKGLLLDLDDTLVPMADTQVSPKVVFAIKRFKQAGKQCWVVSNNIFNYFCLSAQQKLGIPVTGNARKPDIRVFQTVLARMGLNPQEVAVVGDRVLTDMRGGQRLGAKTVLVKSLNRHRENRFMKLFRRMERWLVIHDTGVSNPLKA